MKKRNSEQRGRTTKLKRTFIQPKVTIHSFMNNQFIDEDEVNIRNVEEANETFDPVTEAEEVLSEEIVY